MLGRIIVSEPWDFIQEGSNIIEVEIVKIFKINDGVRVIVQNRNKNIVLKNRYTKKSIEKNREGMNVFTVIEGDVDMRIVSFCEPQIEIMNACLKSLFS